MKKIAGVICVAAGVAIGAYALFIIRYPAPVLPRGAARATRLDRPPERPFIMFASMAADDTFYRLALAPLSDPAGPRFFSDLRCERLDFANTRGVCLTTEFEGLTARYVARVFDETFRVVGIVPLTGVPTRTRFSPDGSRAALTVFESGHSYADAAFSTRTTLVDTLNGGLIEHLEAFAVSKDGAPFRRVDVNYWGVTFVDNDRFFATLATGGIPYLVEGRIGSKTIRILRDHVECPSLSPDGTRLAYKRTTDRRGVWQLHLLDLGTMQDLALTSESRSVDDQVEWLDLEHILYQLPSSQGADVWILKVDAAGPPIKLIPAASSPAVVR